MKSGKKAVQYTLLLILLSLLFKVSAEESLVVNETINLTDANLPNPENETMNLTTNETNTINQNGTSNQTNKTIEITDFEIINLTPKKAEAGDITFDIEVKNTGNVKIGGLVPIIIGRGFSTYDIVPIESLEPDEISHIYVMGNLEEEGDISLNIRIKEKLFYEIIRVESKEETNETKLREVEEARRESIKTLSERLEKIKEDYSSLESEIKKKKGGYDLSSINLEDLKIFIRDAESSLAIGEAEKANASMILAQEELKNQENILDSAQKKPFTTKIRENLLLISTTVGAVVTLFAFYELLKKKKESVYKKIKEFKVNKDTRIVVEKKTENEGKKAESSETKEMEKDEEEAKEETKEKLAEEDVLKSDKPLKELYEENSSNR